MPTGDRYRADDLVWVFRAGGWRPGIVLHATDRAVTVRYRPTDANGSSVDTTAIGDLAPRDTVDPFLDGP